MPEFTNQYEQGIISAVIQTVCTEDDFPNELAAEIVLRAAVEAGIPAEDIERKLKQLYGTEP
jgi:hypothetical protein